MTIERLPRAEEPHVEWDEDRRPIWVHFCKQLWRFFGGPTGFEDFEGGTAYLEELLNPRVPLPIVKPGGWDADFEANTISPSILCTGCQAHGFWTRGEWIPA